MDLTTLETLRVRMNRLGLYERDIIEKFIRASGPGGQNVNKVATCVVLTHKPSGLTVRCEKERTQARNRFLARQWLAERWEALERKQAAQERSAVERARRQKRTRSKSAKERMLKDKHRRSEIKNRRRSPQRDDF